MRVYPKLVALAVVVCAGYTCVGHWVPQLKRYPPKEVSAGSSAIELARAGKEIFVGACGQCHGIPGKGDGKRAPDLDGVATKATGRAQQRSKDTGTKFTADDYLAESLVDPGAYLVERTPGVTYGNVMSFKLEPMQVLAVLAYLQSLGGRPTVTSRSALWKKWAAKGTTVSPPIAAPKQVGPPQQIVIKYACIACHDLEATSHRVGPPLSNIGARMSRGDILMQILYPDSQVAVPPKGVVYAPHMMKNALEQNGFYRDVRAEDLEKLVLWLAEKKGSK